MDFNEAQELLREAAESDPTIGGQAPGEQQEQSNSPAEGSGEGTEATPEVPDNGTEESFTSINPDTLPPELQAGWKQLQAAFTRKTQDLAEQRKAYEGLGQFDPNEALEAVQFVQALQTDPNVAVQLHQELSTYLQAQGLSQAQAHETAAQAIQAQGEESWYDDESEYGAVPPQIQQQLAELQEFKSHFEEQQAQQVQMFELQRQAAAIQQQHPEYGETEMNRIYQLAAWHGDLISAEREYAEMRDYIAGQLFTEKKSVPAGTPTSGTPNGQVPESVIKNVYEAAEAGIERLRASGEL